MIAPALPGHRRRQRGAALLARRRRAAAGHRRRRRRARRARARPIRRSPWCTPPCRPGAGVDAARGRRTFNALVYVLGGAGTVGAETGTRFAPASWPSSVTGHRSGSPLTPNRSRVPPTSMCSPRRASHRRAGLRLRTVRDEHQGGSGPGLRGLSGREARHHPGGPHRLVEPEDGQRPSRRARGPGRSGSLAALRGAGSGVPGLQGGDRGGGRLEGAA